MVSNRGKISENEKIVKVTHYVESADGEPRQYVALETEKRNVIITEELDDGTVTWEENPQNLETRNTLAKVLRSENGFGKGVTATSMKDYYTSDERKASVL